MSLQRLRWLPAIALILAGSMPVQSQYLRIYYPDIEQGSSTLVVSPTGQALLVDGGTGLKPTDDPVEDFINDLVDAGIVTSLDYVLSTHYDEDHIGRLENVFQLVPLGPTVIAYDRGTFSATPNTFAYGDYSYSASFHNRTTIDPFTVLNLGGGVTVRCYVVNGDLPNGMSEPILSSGQFENSASVAVVVQYGDFDAWIGGDLTGDATFGVADVESAVAPFIGDVDVYTLNHHGSRSSSNATFLNTLKAEVGINQNSVNNSHGHPNTQVVNRFLGTPDTDGNVPLFFQQNPGDAADTRSDDTLANGIADCDDLTEPFGLPGTITVLSDGSSYDVVGCGFGSIVLPADSGAGTLGDFPPAILSVSRSPLVPLASEAVVVTAEIADEGTPSAQILYSLDGVQQAPIAMVAGSGLTYTASIPAQLDGVQVRFRVEATDAATQVEVGPARGYFSGVTPVATLRQVDAAGVLIPKRVGVRVEGVVTAEPGIFHPFITQSYAQDATGGVQIFDKDFLPVGRGDRVQFVGFLEQFGGQTELNLSQDFGNYGHLLVGADTVPAPQVVTVSQVGEGLEGTLVRINGLTIVSGTIPANGSGTLTVTDDGGTSTLDLRVDGDTDIPGSNTPTLAFDLVGVVSQFDSFVPLNWGYQILPRERTDFLTEEVNFAQLLIHEIHADPHPSQGDANGDGTISSSQDEFLELVNTGTTALDIGGYTLADGIKVRHTFATGTIVPPREAVVVFSGGSPTGDFGNADANGLVFTASTGRLALNNAGDTVTLADNTAAVLQVVSYNGAGGNNQSLTRDPDFTNTPLVKHSVATGSGGSLYSPGARNGGASFTVPRGAILLTEVVYDPSGSDGGFEWVEIYNTTDQAIDLADMSLGNGGGDYTSSLVQLAGTIAAGETYVIGGPGSSGDNGNPLYDMVVNFSPDFQNGGSAADGVALFNLRASQVQGSTVPVDAVVYGASNVNGLLDETGSANAPDVADAPGGSSVERIDEAGSWQIQASPNPNVWNAGSPPPPPVAGLLLSEVFYDASGGDDGLEWVELVNISASSIDLSNYSLGNGGSSYTSSKVQLSGTIAPGATFVVGGPTSSAANGTPSFDLVSNFSPDFQNGGANGDGVALFAVAASQITSSTVPVDAVIYGPNNSSGLIDETGAANGPEVGDAPAGSAIERTDAAGSWQIQSTPTPNSAAF